MECLLTEDEKKLLLTTARERIRADLRMGFPEYPVPEGNLEKICGAFVTLHKDGMLRGCIGNIVGRITLIDTVFAMAHAAAFEDPRFPELSPEEFSQIEIEISVLSPLREITDISEIEIGTHGIYITREYNSGILLPQVPIEQSWDVDTFIQHTCIKAGLPPDAWKDPQTSIEIFTAIVFSERDLQTN